MACLHGLNILPNGCSTTTAIVSFNVCGDGINLPQSNPNYQNCTYPAPNGGWKIYRNNVYQGFIDFWTVTNCGAYFYANATAGTSYTWRVDSVECPSGCAAIESISGSFVTPTGLQASLAASWTPMSTNVVLNWTFSCEANINSFAIQKWNGSSWDDYHNGISKTLRTFTTTGNTLFTTVTYRVVSNTDTGNYYSNSAVVDLSYLVPANIVGATIPTAYPTLSFSARTTNFDAYATGVNWYRDGAYIATTAGATYTGTLPAIDTNYVITAKYIHNSYVGTNANILNLIFTKTIISGFTSNGTIVIPSGYTYMDYIIVAGGGGGGSAGEFEGGGGGGGGMLENRVYNPIAGTYNVVIGNGGGSGNRGGNSSFYGLTAIGGGGGGTHRTNGLSGGSGGGGGSAFWSGTVHYNTIGGASVSGQGYNGGNSTNSLDFSYSHAAGGGGAGAAGGNGNEYSNAQGGAGRASTMTGYTFSKGGKSGVYPLGPESTTQKYGDGGNGSGLYNGASGKQGIVICKLVYVPQPAINSPTGLTTTSITCTGATLTWHNNNTHNVNGNYVQIYTGTTWTTVATIASGATSYVLTSLIPLTQYTYRVVAYNNDYFQPSASVVFTTLDPKPYNLNATVTNLSAAFTWNILDAAYGTAIRPQIREYLTPNWTTKPNLAKNATSYTFTGLTSNTNYEVQFVRIGSEYPSDSYYFSTLDYAYPTNLHTTSISGKTVCLAWTNNGNLSDNITVWYKITGQPWVLYYTVSSGTTSICVTGLTMGTNYEFVVINMYDVYGLSSNIAYATTPIIFPPAFCSGTNYELTQPATCGNSDGIIWIENLDYFLFYDFTLTDTFGNTYMPNLTTGEFTGLAAGWYTLSVMPFPAYQYHYGNEPCVIEWLPVPDINTTVTLTDTKIRHAVCGGFGNSIGRIVFQFTDSNIAATGWTFSLYTANGVRVNQQVLTDIANVVYNARPNEYYAILENNFGCTCLVDLTQVLAERLYTVTEITDVYLTPWSSAVEYNYYDNTNENWYVAGIDTQQFTSSMIAEYLNLPEPWYEIGIHTAVATYVQNLNKGSNGIVYQEEFRITVPHQDNQKWKDLVNVLAKRYIIVFRDAHGFYWTMGFRSGCEVKAYQLQDNQYQISFIHPASQQLLTSMDDSYVKYTIL